MARQQFSESLSRFIVKQASIFGSSGSMPAHNDKASPVHYFFRSGLPRFDSVAANAGNAVTAMRLRPRMRLRMSCLTVQGGNAGSIVIGTRRVRTFRRPVSLRLIAPINTAKSLPCTGLMLKISTPGWLGKAMAPTSGPMPGTTRADSKAETSGQMATSRTIPMEGPASSDTPPPIP